MRGLPNNVKISLEKARDAALLAVEIYNKPAVKFKSGGYITMMTIAWTALFHAIYFRKKIKPFYKGDNGRYKIRENDYYYWELDECLRNHFGNDTMNPVRVNLEFIIPLRNKIEHKSLPELDSNIFGECQASLLNFDEFIEREFGEKYCLRESLSFSLQLFPSKENISKVISHNPTTKPIINFIENYRSSVSSETFESNKYSFKAFLIQVSNHQSKDALPIQFVHYDNLTEDQRAELGKFVAMVKYKEVGISNVDKLKSSEVVELVQKALGDIKIQKGKASIAKFNADTHTRCWKKYKVRPDSKSKQPHLTTTDYCVYDKPHKDYLYTAKWASFLIEKMKDEQEYSSLYKK